MRIDIIIATCKPLSALVKEMYEIRKTAACEMRIIPTCLQESASVNRNYGLDKAETDIIIMMDDDISGLPNGWDLTLVETLVHEQQCVMVSPRLITPDGCPGLMLGHPPPLMKGEWWEVPDRELPTACIAIRKNDLRFDEIYEGSGWEDTDMCAQLRQEYPEGKFIVNSYVKVIHHNEMKNQGGEIFERNKARFFKKWG
jgi:glycosyltransferase involved in cell wall biosynthesis